MGPLSVTQPGVTVGVLYAKTALAGRSVWRPRPLYRPPFTSSVYRGPAGTAKGLELTPVPSMGPCQRYDPTVMVTDAVSGPFNGTSSPVSNLVRPMAALDDPSRIRGRHRLDVAPSAMPLAVDATVAPGNRLDWHTTAGRSSLGGCSDRQEHPSARGCSGAHSRWSSTCGDAVPLYTRNPSHRSSKSELPSLGRRAAPLVGAGQVRTRTTEGARTHWPAPPRSGGCVN